MMLSLGNSGSTYRGLVRQGGGPEHDASIMRDLGRTFPTHLYFAERQVGRSGS